MTYEEIETIYGIIKEFHEKYLAMHGVKLPAIKESGKYTKNALVLIYLAKDYPDTHIVSKDFCKAILSRHK
jgi:N-acyl-L-homoserine lactone synthetase